MEEKKGQMKYKMELDGQMGEKENRRVREEMEMRGGGGDDVS